MRKWISLALAVVSIMALCMTRTAEAAPEIRTRSHQPPASGPEFAQDEVIVKFRPGVPGTIITGVLARLRASVQAVSRAGGAFHRVRIPAGASVAEMVQLLERDPAVEYAEPNFIAHADWVPNDQYYRYQWHLDSQGNGGIQMEQAWDVEDGDPGVIIAVVDTGVAYENYGVYSQAPDLTQTSFVPGYDFVNNDSHPNDDEGHGTHVTGTIAQSTHNAIGTAGVAFACSIMPVKVLNSSGSGYHTAIADGIRFAADRGVKVINMSLGGSTGSTTLSSALAYGASKGVTFVCSSGNNGSSTTISYPAAYDSYCIAVGATRYDETVAYYSNRGASLDLVAPGGDLNVDQNLDGYGDGVLQQTFGSTFSDWAYWFYQGTSMAAPHVSGVAGLVIARGIASTPAEVRNVLQSTTDDKGAAGWDSTYGHGLLNAQAALAYGAPVANQPPIAAAGSDQTIAVGQAASFSGSASSDSDGSIVSYEWDFGDGATASGVSVSHAYTTAGSYTVGLTVTDDDGAPGVDTALVTVTATTGPIEVFSDSFDVSEWNGLWTEDSQNDWARSAQRAVSGAYSAEIDGYASEAALMSTPINLQGRTSATITFSWLIESTVDLNEQLAFDTSTDGGATWIQRATLRGNVDPENVWRQQSITLSGISSLRLRFRGRMNLSTEDANVDMVQVVAQ